VARRCLVCASPERARVDATLRGTHNVSQLARDLNVARQVIMRHRANHVGPAPIDLSRNKPKKAEISRNNPPAPPQPRQEPVTPTSHDPQTAFLTSYAAGGDIKAALKDADITRPQLRKWQEHDEAFALRFHQAEAEAIEALEAEARIRAVAGSRMVRRVYRQGLLYEEIHEYRPSDAMLVKLLQAHKPDKYGDKLAITQTTVVKAVDAEAWDAV
jgi:hypothetical protein